MDILIIAVLIIAAVILFLVELFVIPESASPVFRHWLASSMLTTMHLPIWAWREDSLLWEYQLLPASGH